MWWQWSFCEGLYSTEGVLAGYLGAVFGREGGAPREQRRESFLSLRADKRVLSVWPGGALCVGVLRKDAYQEWTEGQRQVLRCRSV